MLHPRRQSTTTGFTSCGGVELETNNAIYNCETFDPSTGKLQLLKTLELAMLLGNIRKESFLCLEGVEPLPQLSLVMMDQLVLDGI